MNVTCPDCQTTYLLPEHLLGPGGARVRCPHCKQPFVVLRDAGAPAGPAEAAEEAGAVEAAAAPVGAEPLAAAEGADEGESESVANELIADLDARIGSRLADARARGKVLAEVGPDLVAAFDEYRARLGKGANDEVFWRVLQERLGISLGNR